MVVYSLATYKYAYVLSNTIPAIGDPIIAPMTDTEAIVESPETV